MQIMINFKSKFVWCFIFVIIVFSCISRAGYDEYDKMVLTYHHLTSAPDLTLSDQIAEGIHHS